MFKLTNGPWHEKNLSSGFGNNKDAVQPVHPCSLISTFVIRLLESIVSKLAIREIAFFYLASVAEQAGLNLTVGNLEVFLFVWFDSLCPSQQFFS